MRNFSQKLERTVCQTRSFYSRVHSGEAGTEGWRKKIVTIFLAILPLFSAHAAVDSIDVDQSPLIVSDPLPPNIVLMLDDSGSMAFDYMPNLSGNSSSTGWRAPSVNRVYYDPSVTYLPPFMADGGRYPEITTFPNAPLNGYDSSSESKFIPAWRSPFKYFYFGKFGGESCPSGTTESGWDDDYCYSGSERTDLAHLFYTTRRVNGRTYYYYEKTRFGAFAYTKQNGAEVLISESCSEKPNNMSGTCVDANDTSGAAAPTGVEAGVNVANWFAYYRTRVFASKAGVILMSQVLANEWGASGVRVNVVAPGPVDTPLIASLHTVEDRKRWTAQIPLRRYGQPSEIADAILFLLSPQASYINGHVLTVDGGFSTSGIIAGR